MRISDWSSDVCSSDLRRARLPARRPHPAQADRGLGPTGPPDRGVVANGRGVPAPCATAHRYGGRGTTGKHARAWHLSAARPRKDRRKYTSPTPCDQIGKASSREREWKYV